MIAQFFEKIWQKKGGISSLLLPFSYLFGAISCLRKKLYEKNILSSWKANVPVVVVGNLSVGGNGKTPIVIWLTETLKKKGFNVGIISRGYGGKTKNYPFLVDQNTKTNEAGDEPILIYQRTNSPVAISPNRRAAIECLLKNYSIDVIIADDGLQHYALFRDIEIVVLDGMNRFGNGYYLPAGPLREKPSRLNSVDFIINNGGTLQNNEIPMQLKTDFVVNLLNPTKKLPLESLKNVVAFAGIGKPERFFNLLKSKNVNVIATKAFRDHQNYEKKMIESLEINDSIILMTEKDAVKCQKFANENWWFLPISVEFSMKDERKIIELITEKINKNTV